MGGGDGWDKEEWGRKRENELLRKLINERDGLRVLHIQEWHTDLNSVHPGVQIYIKASNSLVLGLKGWSPPPLFSPPRLRKLEGDAVTDLIYIHFGSSLMWLHFILLAVHRALSQRWGLAYTTAVTTDFFPSFFLWAVVSQWDLSLGFVSLSLYGCKFPHCRFIRPQIAPQSCKDKWLAN